MLDNLRNFLAWQAFSAGSETALILIAPLLVGAIWLLIGRYSWPKLAGAIRSGLVLGWWIAFGLGLLWSLA